MAILFYNTLTRKKEEFLAHNKKTVKLYTCGPTVYDYAHIGNLRSYIFADILRRTLQCGGYTVNHIENITDVGHLVSDADSGEDKMMRALHRDGLEPTVKSLKTLAKKYTDAFLEDIKRLNILPPKKWTPATRYVKEMVAFIQKIAERGFAYETSLALYFDVAKFPGYGKLSGQKLEEKISGARDEVEIDPEKKHPADFVLWFKLAGKNKNHLMHWPSPWGEGFPGWHIECSAMSVKELGSDIDIHTGGIDHIPVHHTNERAQNYAAYGTEVVHFWMHNEFLVTGEDKMAKSAGNFFTLQALLDKKYDPLSYRYFCLNTHYRQKLQFSWEALSSAQNALNNLRQSVSEYGAPRIGCAEYERRFFEALHDDLNTPRALGILWELVHDKELPGPAKRLTINRFDEIFGLGLQKLQKIIIPKNVERLAALRENARAEKDWARADELRRELEKLGFDVQDSKAGPNIRKKDDYKLPL